MNTEEDRIKRAYIDRAERVRQRTTFFTYQGVEQYLRGCDRYLKTLEMFESAGLRSLAELEILDVGCGTGDMLRRFIMWGAQPERLHGIELRQDAVDTALYLSPHLDIRCNSAIELPYDDRSFDLVTQHTVFTSILDNMMKRKVAEEMNRVLKPVGVIEWYDFRYNNPKNPDVRGIGLHEIRDLFPDYSIIARTLTLAPPVGRRIPEAFLPILYPILSLIPALRTHYLCVMKKTAE